MARRKPRVPAPGTTPAGGRPTRLLDPGIYQAILDALELGVPITIACQGVGIAEQSYRNWLARGRTEHEARADYEAGDPDAPAPDEDEDLYVDFYLGVIAARTKAATRSVAVIQKAAQGGAVTEKSTKRYTDNQGNDVVEETVKRSAPDWRAAAWYLERSHRSEYGKDSTVVEITGPRDPAADDTDAIDGPATPASELAARFSEHLAAGVAALTAGPTATTDDTDTDEVLEAELVEA